MCGADEGQPIVIMKSDLEIAVSALRMIIYFPTAWLLLQRPRSNQAPAQSGDSLASLKTAEEA